MSTVEKIFAEKLLKVKAIKLQPEQPFTWASGWKSPFYCDNRKTLAFPALRTFVKLQLSRIVAERYPEADAIAGVATGAIAQGALVADELALPFAYVRSRHGQPHRRRFAAGHEGGGGRRPHLHGRQLAQGR